MKILLNVIVTVGIVSFSHAEDIESTQPMNALSVFRNGTLGEAKACVEKLEAEILENTENQRARKLKDAIKEVFSAEFAITRASKELAEAKKELEIKQRNLRITSQPSNLTGRINYQGINQVKGDLRKINASIKKSEQDIAKAKQHLEIVLGQTSQSLAAADRVVMDPVWNKVANRHGVAMKRVSIAAHESGGNFQIPDRAKSGDKMGQITSRHLATILKTTEEEVRTQMSEIESLLKILGIEGSTNNLVSPQVILRYEAVRVWYHKNISVDPFELAKKDLNRLARHICSPDGMEKLVFINVIHEENPQNFSNQRWSLNEIEFKGVAIEKIVKDAMRYPTMPIKTRKEFEIILGYAIEHLEKTDNPDLKILRGRYLERLKNFDRKSEEARAAAGKWRSYQRFVIESGIDFLTLVKTNDRITSVENQFNGGLPFTDEPNWRHFDAAFGDTPTDDMLGAFALLERAMAVRDPMEFLKIHLEESLLHKGTGPVPIKPSR